MTKMLEGSLPTKKYYSLMLSLFMFLFCENYFYLINTYGRKIMAAILGTIDGLAASKKFAWGSSWNLSSLSFASRNVAISRKTLRKRTKQNTNKNVSMCFGDLSFPCYK